MLMPSHRTTTTLCPVKVHKHLLQDSNTEIFQCHVHNSNQKHTVFEFLNYFIAKYWHQMWQDWFLIILILCLILATCPVCSINSFKCMSISDLMVMAWNIVYMKSVRLHNYIQIIQFIHMIKIKIDVNPQFFLLNFICQIQFLGNSRLPH